MLNGMIKTVRDSVVGTYPSCHSRSRLEKMDEDRPSTPELRTNGEMQENFVLYGNGDVKDNTPSQQDEVLRTSYNICDYLKSRENGLKEVKCAVY